jgi:hypothetical protein
LLNLVHVGENENWKVSIVWRPISRTGDKRRKTINCNHICFVEPEVSKYYFTLKKYLKNTPLEVSFLGDIKKLSPALLFFVSGRIKKPPLEYFVVFFLFWKVLLTKHPSSHCVPLIDSYCS